MLTAIIIFLVIVCLVVAYYLGSWAGFNYGTDTKMSFDQFLESYQINKERWTIYEKLFHDALYYDSGEGSVRIAMNFVDYIRLYRFASDCDKQEKTLRKREKADRMHKRMKLDEQIAAMTSPEAIQKILDARNCPELHYVGLNPSFKYEAYKYNMYDVVTTTEQKDYILQNVKVYVKWNEAPIFDPWLLLDDYIRQRDESLGIEEETKNA
jgi:hypothetical protein